MSKMATDNGETSGRVENLLGQESVSMENFELIRMLGKGGECF